MEIECPFFDKYRAVAQPQYPSPPSTAIFMMSPRYGAYSHPLSRHNSFRTQSTINPSTAQTFVDFPHPGLSSARTGAFEAVSPQAQRVPARRVRQAPGDEAHRDNEAH